MNVFEYIKTQVSILDVVREYVALKPAGSYWKGFSPFKHEKTPSFTVSPHRGIYYCFSTAHGGDVIDFIAKVENCSALDAAQHLIEHYSIKVPEALLKASPQNAQQSGRPSHTAVCTLFAQWCHQQLLHNATAHAYAINRGMPAAMLTRFMIGFCPNSTFVEKFLSVAREKGILAQDALQARIISEGKTGLYFPFDERIIFPIFNHMGHVCGFGGRVYRPDDTRPKYFNSHDHEQFNKKQILFGFNLAKKSIQTTATAYLVEGYTDCIAMVNAGYENCVATLGTACTTEHLELLSRHAKKLFVLYDGDTAGQNAIMRLATLCWHYNLDVWVLPLPSEDDPASYLQKYQSLEVLQRNAQSIFQFFVARSSADFLTLSTQEKLQKIEAMLNIIATINNPLQQDLLMQNMASACALPFATIKQEFANLRHRAKGPEQRSSPATNVPIVSTEPCLSAIGTLEKKIFSAIVNTDIRLEHEDELFLQTTLPSPLCTWLERLHACDYSFETFFTQLSSAEQDQVSSLTLCFDAHDQAYNTLMSLLTQFQKKQWKLIINDVKMKLSTVGKSTGDGTAREAILQEFDRVKNYMMRRGIV